MFMRLVIELQFTCTWWGKSAKCKRTCEWGIKLDVHMHVTSGVLIILSVNVHESNTQMLWCSSENAIQFVLI